MRDSRPLLLDTNICVAYARRGLLGEWIENRYQLMARPEKPIISVVTYGELLALVKQFGWGQSKVRQLDELLRQLVIADIHDSEILRSYAETDFHSGALRPSVRMQKNDLWIAATAHALGLTLMTTDKVFDHLHPRWVERIYVDERVVKSDQ